MDELKPEGPRLEKRFFFGFLLILIIGFLLRIYRLDAVSLWYDELSTIGRISCSLSQIIKNLLISPLPPLYYILMHSWVKIFGISEFSLRFPSVVFSVLSLILIFKLSKELFGRQTGLFAALLLSLSLYNIDYAREGKMYAMLWFFGLASFYFFYAFTRHNRIRDLVLYAISTGITFYTLYIGFFFIVIQNLVFFLLFFNPRQLKKWVITQILLIVACLPLAAFSMHNVMLGDKSSISWIPKEVNYLTFLFNVFYFLFARTPLITVKPGLINVCIIAIYVFLFVSAFARPGKEKESVDYRKNEYFLLAWILIPPIMLCLIHAFVLPILVIRYLGLIHIPLIILFSKGLNSYGTKMKYALLMVILFITFSFQLYPYYKSNSKAFILYPEDWKGLFARINKEKGGNALVVTSDNFLYFNKSIKYYNNSQEIKWLGDDGIENDILDKKYDSIFVIYYLNPYIRRDINGYRLYRRYADKRMGYLVFMKLRDARQEPGGVSSK